MLHTYKKLLLRAFLLCTPLFFFLPHAQAATYTVCDTGCDQPTLSAAVQIPGLGSSNDTLELTGSYIFDMNMEDSSISLPSNVTLSCDSGAGAIGSQADVTFNINGGSNALIENCTFENANIDFTGGNNIEYSHNTFSPNAETSLTFTVASDIRIHDNTDLQKIQLQTADNVTIENNTFACRFENACLNVVTAGSPDYSLDSDISNDVTIQNNTFVNYKIDNSGDWIGINGGRNILFNNNTVRSDVVMNDVYITMITITNAQAEFHNNLVITPQKQPGATNGTWAFNMRLADYNLTPLYDHNTVYFSALSSGNSNDACMGLYDNGSYNNVPVNITATYNLCYQGNPTASGVGINLSSVLGSAVVQLTDSFNGFYNFNQIVQDSTNTITALNSNTLTRDPLFRRDNVQTDDDFDLNPASVYLDVDGTTDIGRYSAVRQQPILVDDDCTVDYVTCYGKTSAFIQAATRNGDTIHIAAGTYNPLDLSNLTNITLEGAGADTIFDSTSASHALALHNVSSSHISGVTAKNATQSSTQYMFTSDSYTYNSTVYDSIGGVVLIQPSCNNGFLPANTPMDVTASAGIGTDNLNLFLISLPPMDYLTVYAPSSVAATPSDLAALCGVPVSFIDKYVPNLITVNAGVYTLDTAAAASAGITPSNGSPNPNLARLVSSASGLFVDNSSNNIFDNITVANNARGLELSGTSANNTITSSSFSTNALQDIFADTTGSNVLEETAFDPTKVQFNQPSSLYVRQRPHIIVKSQSPSMPLENASVTLTDIGSGVTGPLMTDAQGEVILTGALPAYTLDQSTPYSPTAGGFNPYSIRASKDGFATMTITASILTPGQTFTITLPATGSPAGGGSSSSGGSGGGFPATPPSSGSSLHPSSPDGSTSSGQTLPGQEDITKDFSGYKDLPSTDARFAAFAYAKSLGAIEGFADGTVGPNLNLQRDQIAKILTATFYKLSPEMDYCQGVAPFPDVPLNQWSAQYICFAKAKGIVTGYTGMEHDDAGKFRPERPVSRAELLAMVIRSIPALQKTAAEGNYEDVLPGPWYVQYAAIAHELHLFPITLPLGADRPATRAEVALMLFSLHIQGYIK